ncbi:MAG TPA: helix-turn-helix domain-containing protein [Defluviitaleaceae bacterium]|nr:helix-turn-helix domain-containing protein [Defluviitaleaceae bacterium]HQD92558.1 helix-turn-helix domain-containing protein [Bacilli bacterium]
MNQYVTGAIIKQLREKRKMTQLELAEILNVSDKTVSKWETGKGYPDITLIETIAKALGISTIELLSGDNITNNNRSFNMLKVVFYICPICGNIITATGQSVISCCGIVLPPLEAEVADDEHAINIEKVEDEYYVSINHEMSKEHHISFIAAIADNGVEICKLYAEGNAEARFKTRRTKYLYWYCNHHGLFKIKVPVKNKNI